MKVILTNAVEDKKWKLPATFPMQPADFISISKALHLRTETIVFAFSGVSKEGMEFRCKPNASRKVDLINIAYVMRKTWGNY